MQRWLHSAVYVDFFKHTFYTIIIFTYLHNWSLQPFSQCYLPSFSRHLYCVWLMNQTYFERCEFDVTLIATCTYTVNIAMSMNESE